jgi:MFS superfamily sulfate permease-like transporter
MLFVYSLPAPRLPHVDRLMEVAVDAVGVAFVIFAIGISMAQIYASKHNYHVDPNQVDCELLCLTMKTRF